MKVLVEADENTEGMLGLVGKRVTLFCANYIYTGKLVGVDKEFVKLDDAAIVYETGEFDAESWKDAQALPHSWYVAVGAIESFGVMK